MSCQASSHELKKSQAGQASQALPREAPDPMEWLTWGPDSASTRKLLHLKSTLGPAISGSATAREQGEHYLLINWSRRLFHPLPRPICAACLTHDCHALIELFLRSRGGALRPADPRMVWLQVSIVSIKVIFHASRTLLQQAWVQNSLDHRGCHREGFQGSCCQETKPRHELGIFGYFRPISVHFVARSLALDETSTHLESTHARAPLRASSRRRFQVKVVSNSRLELPQ